MDEGFFMAGIHPRFRAIVSRGQLKELPTHLAHPNTFTILKPHCGDTMVEAIERKIPEPNRSF